MGHEQEGSVNIKKCCPHCGHIADLPADASHFCPHCKATGHLYRMLTRGEMLDSATNWEGRGYPITAGKRRKLARGMRQCS